MSGDAWPIARGSEKTVGRDPKVQKQSICLFFREEVEWRLGDPFLETSLPEENIPEKQPTRIQTQGQYWEEEGAIGVVFQHTLGQCCKEELPTLCQRQWHLLKLPPQEQATEKRDSWAGHYQQGSIECPGEKGKFKYVPWWVPAKVLVEKRLTSTYRGPWGLVSAAAGTMVAASRKPREKLRRAMQPSCSAR